MIKIRKEKKEVRCYDYNEYKYVLKDIEYIMTKKDNKLVDLKIKIIDSVSEMDSGFIIPID